MANGPSSTTIRSARAIVERRWATMRQVVCLDRRILSIASFTWARVSLRNAALGSPYHAPGVQRLRLVSSLPHPTRVSPVSSAMPVQWQAFVVVLRSSSSARLHVSLSMFYDHTRCGLTYFRCQIL